MRADAVVSDTGSGGIAPEVVAAVQDLPETGTVTTVQDTQVLLPYSLLAETEVMRAAARGVTEEGVTATLDLGVTSGDLDGLADLPGRGVALDRSTARALRARVGDEVDVVLGDGATTRLQVVALYERGLGAGGVVLPSSVLGGHAGAPTHLLVEASGQAGAEELQDALRPLLRRYPTLRVSDQASFTEVARSEATMTAWVNLAGALVIIAFIGVAVVNNLVIATLNRSRDLALLRLAGATNGQILWMLGLEAVTALLLAVLLGTAVAALPLTVLSLALLGSPLPAGPPWVYVAVVAGAGALATVSVGLAGLRVLRAVSRRGAAATGIRL